MQSRIEILNLFLLEIWKYGDKGLNHDIAFIVLMIENIIDICDKVDRKYS